ncbi:MAG: hypothetical protein L6R42_008240 [Xanthoria sp. 1 TBL-2021]|nr:MAG: hypothetical protein L6R42_008240 [Xanthoria sp. 1 TBL-2021]
MDMGPSKPKQPHLTTYVHRDIKPDNIFLAAPQAYDNGGIPIYPTARLGDFGLAIPTGEEDVHHNPYELKELGTYGYKAPEQKYGFEELEVMSMSAEDREELDDFVPQGVTQDWPMLGTHTNIWGVGASMYELMVLTGLTFDLTKAVVEGRALGKVQTHRIPEYSKPLTDLVHHCLKSDPARRPKLEKLENIIESRRSYFRDRWSAGETVPEEAALHLDPDEIDKMDIGPFVKGEHIQYDLDQEKRKTF